MRNQLSAVLAGAVLALSGAAVTAAPAAAVGPIGVGAHPQTPAFVPGWAHTTQDDNAPDPDVVRFGSSYFAYTTGTTWGNHLGVLVSSAPDRGFHTVTGLPYGCLLYTSPSPRDGLLSRMPSSA